MSRLLLSGAHVICPFTGVDSTGDVLVADGRVAAVRPGGGLVAPDAERVDCAGKVLAPGFIDLHTHLREPGEEHKETLETGAAAALAGGWTALCAMPNTRPALDSPRSIELVRQRSERLGVRVFPVGAVTTGRAGEQLVPFDALAAAGAVGFSDDGSPVANAVLMRSALQYSVDSGLPVISHCEDPDLSADGSMHDGAVSARLGLRGIPASAEEVMVRRDIALAEETGGRLHIAHVSTAGGVDAVRQAKARGVLVTAEAMPHHLLLTDEWVAGWGTLNGEPHARQDLAERAYDTSTKVNPPLRSREHVDAVVEGLCNGTIDVIATDHAPHSSLEKDTDYDSAAMGISGLETALGLLLELVRSGKLTLQRLIELLTLLPARTFDLPARGICEGAKAELVVFDPELEWVVEPYRLLSKGKNTPLAGHTLRGRVLLTMAGERLYRAPKLEAR